MALNSSIRLVVLAMLVAGLSLLSRDGLTQAQAEAIKPELPLTAEQTKKLKDRDRLISQVNKLGKQRRLDEAARLFEKVIVLQKGIYGEPNELAAQWQAALAKLHLRREDFPAARAASAASLNTYTQIYGKNHWEVSEARWTLRDVELLAKLTPAERGVTAFPQPTRAGWGNWAKQKTASEAC